MTKFQQNLTQREQTRHEGAKHMEDISYKIRWYLPRRQWILEILCAFAPILLRISFLDNDEQDRLRRQDKQSPSTNSFSNN